jgi:hypothetical protein
MYNAYTMKRKLIDFKVTFKFVKPFLFLLLKIYDYRDSVTRF